MRKLKELEEEIRAKATLEGPNSDLWEWVWALQSAMDELEVPNG